MSGRRSKILDVIEAGLARAGLAIVDAIPLRLSLKFSRGVGALAYALLAKRRKVAIGNLLSTGVAKDEGEARRIAKESFKHFAMLAVESICAMKQITPDTLARHAEIIVPPETDELLKDPGQGMILVTGHIGNWEVAGHIVSFIKPLVAVARRMDNPLFRDMMEKRNPRRRMEIVPKHSPDRLALLRALKRGCTLALISDQYASSNYVEVPFFGRMSRTVSSPARLHLATHCPIVCGYGERVGFMKFRLRLSKPIMFEATGDKEADCKRIMADMNLRIEEIIRACPEQYLWSHRRWKDKRPAENAKGRMC